MKNFLLTILFILAVSGITKGQNNWTAYQGYRTPNSQWIPSSSKLNVGGKFKWNSNVSFINDNHLCRLVYAFPLCLNGLTGNPIIKVNGITNENVNFIFDSIYIYCLFPPNTVFSPNTIIDFDIYNLEIYDDTVYTNQKLTHWIDFIAAPAETSISDNTSITMYFNVYPVEVALGIKTDSTSAPILYPSEDIFNVYPNPVGNNIIIECIVLKESRITAEIYSIGGKKIINKSFLIDRGSYKKYLDLSGLSPGFYYFKLIKNNKVVKYEKITVL